MSLSRKVNTGNYNSADVFVSVSGIGPTTTQEEIDAILDGPGALAFNSIRERLTAQVKIAKAQV